MVAAPFRSIRRVLLRSAAPPSARARPPRRCPARDSGPVPVPGRACATPRSPDRRPGAAPSPRISIPRAAVMSSMASTRPSPSIERRSLRAALQPIDTWSSCIALVGIESTDAGAARRLSSLTIAGLGVLRDHVPGVDTRVVGQERVQAAAAGLVEEAVGAPLAHARDIRRRDREKVEHVAERCAVEVAVGLDATVERDRPGCRSRSRARARRPGGRGRACPAPLRAPAARSGASRRPARG